MAIPNNNTPSYSLVATQLGLAPLLAAKITVPTNAQINDLLYYDGANWSDLTLGTGLVISNGILNAATGQGVWGQITGTLSNQVDLSAALAGKQATLTVGSLAETGSGVLVVTGGVNSVIGSGVSIQVRQANSSQSGYLSSADWTTFNNKLGPGSYITALTGDATATGPGSAVLTLATVNSTSGTYAGITFNAKGLITTATPLTTLSGYGITDGVNSVSNGTNVTGVVSGHSLTLGWTGYLGVTSGGTGVGTLSGVVLGNGTSIFTTASLSGLTLSSGTIFVNLDAGLPSQTGQSGKFLTTNGIVSSWSTPPGGGNVSSTGSPTNGQLAIWTATTNTIKGESLDTVLNLSALGLVRRSAANTYIIQTSGDLTETGSSVLTIGSGTGAVLGSGTTIDVAKASATISGYLSSTDWNTFNNKAPTATPTFSGTVTFSSYTTAGIVTNNSLGAIASLSNATTLNSTLMGLLGASWANLQTLYLRADGKWATVSGGGSGTVTSVTFTGDGVVLSNTPSSAVTTSGTVTASLLAQTANHVLAGPSSGPAAAPTFRALIIADLPTSIPNTNLASSYVSVNGTSISLGSSGTVTAAADTLTGSTLATGVTASSLTTAAGGSFGTGAYAAAYMLPTASTTVLGGVKVDGSTITITSGTISASGSLTNPMTALGDTIYGGSSGTPIRLAGNTSAHVQFLSQLGTGSASAAPVWSNFPWFNVKDYGALGNNSADDQGAISAAIAALNSAGGGTLLFPSGTYLLTTQYGTGTYLRPITVPCLVVGGGRQNTTVMANGSYADDVFSFGTSGTPVETGSTIENIGIGTQGTNTNALISVYGASNNENVNMVFRSLYLGFGQSIPGKWFSGGNYEVGIIIYDSSVSAYYYCTSAVSGSTPPHSDGSHWATSTYSIINNPVYGIKTYQTGNNTLDSSYIGNCQYNLYWYSDSVGSDQDLAWGSITGNCIEGGVYGIYHIDDHGEFLNANIFYGNCYHYYSTVTYPVSNSGNSDTKITGNWFDTWGPGRAYNSSVSSLPGAAISFNLAGSSPSSLSPSLTEICITGNSFSCENQNGFGGNAIEVFGGWNYHYSSDYANRTGAWRWTITDNQIGFGGEANANGIYLSNCSYMTVSGNGFYQVGATTGSGVYVGSGCYEITINPDQIFYQNSGPGIVRTIYSIASAATILLPYNTGTVMVTGSTSISQINLTARWDGGTVAPYQGQKLILMNEYGGSSISLTGGGNIAANVTIGAGQCCQVVSDGTRWYPSV